MTNGDDQEPRPLPRHDPQEDHQDLEPTWFSPAFGVKRCGGCGRLDHIAEYSLTLLCRRAAIGGPPPRTVCNSTDAAGLRRGQGFASYQANAAIACMNLFTWL
jgi:hypothetical protein